MNSGLFGTSASRDLPVVLLVDDDLICREVTATLLTLRGYTVHSTEDGATALNLLDQGALTPKLILMDAQLPGMHGLDLIQALKTRINARIVVISGSEGAPDVIEASDGFLLKPFSAEALVQLMESGDSPTPPMSAGTSEPVLSKETLARFREIMPEPMVREIYAAVAADLKERSEALRAAIAEKDATTVRRIGHAIKGGCGMAGVHQAARLGALLESESDQLDNSAKVLNDLRAVTQSLERMLEAEFPVQAM